MSDDLTMIYAARDRARVRIPGPVVATLVFWPKPAGQDGGRREAKARVRLDSGSYLSVPTADVELLPDAG